MSRDQSEISSLALTNRNRKSLSWNSQKLITNFFQSSLVMIERSLKVGFVNFSSGSYYFCLLKPATIFLIGLSTFVQTAFVLMTFTQEAGSWSRDLKNGSNIIRHFKN